MMTERFIGRTDELAALRALLRKRAASLVAVYGRRRIGKSRLTEEFSKDFERAFFFSGLPPAKGIGPPEQRQEFARLLAHQVGETPPPSDDWGELFWALADAAKGRVLVVLDEISWMGADDPLFLPKLKNAWDMRFKKNSKLILILSGSVSLWIAKNILSSTGFLGRASLELQLRELSPRCCVEFWGERLVSDYEKLKILAVTGGVPRYLEEIDVSQTAENNLRRLCFERHGLLVGEFDRIFSDLYASRAPAYKRLIDALVHGPADGQSIAQSIGAHPGGDIYEYLDELCISGFVARDHTWNLKDGTPGKLSMFRLSDNYSRFFLRYIAPKRQGIARGDVSTLPRNWESILGLQFENLVLNARRELWAALGIEPADVVASNPFHRRRTQRGPGCQIDYLIQDRFRTLHLCEVKFSKDPIGPEVITAIMRKAKALRPPRGFSVRPVLIHVGGVTAAVADDEQLAHIVDFGRLLQQNEP